MIRTVTILSAVVCIALLTLTGCNGHRGLLSSGVVAQVGKAELHESDIVISLPAGSTPEDSLMFVDAYVNSWVRKQLKLQEAEKVLEKRGVDVEAMVTDYRNSILTYRLDQYYIEQKLDTIITDSLVQEYYDAHRSEHILDRNIIKGSIVKLPVSFRQQAKLKELMGSSNPERQQDFLDMAAKNNLLLTKFDNWVGFDEVLNYLPTIRGKSYDYLLTDGKVAELSDGDFKYYIFITDHLKKGDQAPLEWAANVVRKIIYNKRSSDIVKATEDSLYHAAQENNTLNIYLTN